MPISNVRFAGYQPTTTKLNSKANLQKPVTFTGYQYHKIITNHVSLKGTWVGIKELFSNIGKFFKFLKPHVDKANTALDKSFSTFWQKFKPVK
ncbi:MAG: hypothetical protein AB7V50_07455 [Vampirovibrionia bacterium]